MADAFIVGGVRTPIGRYGGSLSTVRADGGPARRTSRFDSGHHGQSMTRALLVMAKPNRSLSTPDGVTSGISREEADDFALRSRGLARAARAADRFAAEIVSVTTPPGVLVSVDEGLRVTRSLEALAALRPVVPGGSIVAAGNSSPVNDAGAAVMIVSEVALKKYGLGARASVVGGASAGVAPEVMRLRPIPAERKPLSQTALANRRGTIALEHPLEAAGTRTIVTLLGRLERAPSSGQLGLATMCVGVGQGAALLVETV